MGNLGRSHSRCVLTGTLALLCWCLKSLSEAVFKLQGLIYLTAEISRHKIAPSECHGNVSLLTTSATEIHGSKKDKKKCGI